ncbi:MAG: hypothetical protein IKX35_09810 [Bacteroidales bacterium]|nr:hypothetical protein [Bacteroidales bacterium]
MKKLALALLCLVSVAFFASCEKTVEHPEPMIAVLSGEGYINGTVDEPTVIDAYDEDAIDLKYGFHVEYNSETKKELSTLKITWEYTYYDEGEEVYTYDTIIDLTGETSYDYSDYLFEQDRAIITLMDGKITAVVTDADNQSSTAAIAFTLEMEEEELPIELIEWVRKGQDVLSAEEMAEYGLEWDRTFKAPFATIKPMEGAIMYVCDGDDFADIKYWSDKNAYFTKLVAEGATPAESYRNIDANEDSSYNDMLAVVYGDELFLIHITYADIETGTYGTQITIKGAAK